MSSQFSAEVSDSTLAMYNSNLRTIAKALGVKDWIKSGNWLFQKQNELFKFIEETPNIHTRKNRVASLLWFAELHAVPAPVTFRLKSIQIDCFAQLQKGYNTNEKNDKQEDNWVTLKEIDDKIAELKEPDPHTSAHSKKVTRIKYLMLLFHRHLPIRNDLRMTKIVSGDIPEDTSVNYLVKQGDRWILVLNKYKTAGTYGQKVIDVPDVVGEELTKHLKIGEWFYQTHPSGEPVSTQQYSNTFRSIFPDKKVGSTQIRRTVVSSVHQPKPHELEAKQELAFIMGHSVGTAQSVYAKI